ncbi:fatty acid desaturase [Picosynechococcus sp. NKBG15041c]|uniref:fatty acid desaturase n=1 Tax=Picosynechococcus sp. NKBG15041c TaxID=1407650 RepID=UPI001F01A2BC|nr:fatty acid desaturase [Picosynechococcus sp. NKBG15041c]
MRLSWRDERLGLLWAIAIFAAWLGSAIYYLSQPLTALSWVGIAAGIGLRTFFHTGLFILAHDAMHGNLWPSSPRWNHRLGRWSVRLYACLSYRDCIRNHVKHHHQPAQPGDPDFHNGHHADPLRWYWHFMGKYLSWGQLWGFVGIFGAIAFPLHLIGQVSYENFSLFYLLPIFFSSLQLFVFGTYLPHRDRPLPRKPGPKNAILRQMWSFFSCYHFGVFHAEHHRQPQQPWFRLPRCRNS